MIFASFLVALWGGQSLSVPKVQFQISSDASLYASVRSYAADPRSRVPSELMPAVQAARAFEATMPDKIRMPSGAQRSAINAEDRSVKDLYWQFLDSTILSSGDLSKLPARVANFPKTIGGYLEPGKQVAPLADALAAAKPWYESKMWPKDRSLVEKQLRYWHDKVEPRWADIYGFLSDSYGIGDPPPEILVEVVPRLPGKGGITLRAITGPFVVVGVDKFRADNFAECVTHEAIHALEVDSGHVTFLNQLRANLRAQKVDAFTQDQLPHTTFFMTAAEAIRRFVQPRHRDLGETLGTYGRGLEKFRGPAQPCLQRLWDKKITPADAAKELGKG